MAAAVPRTRYSFTIRAALGLIVILLLLVVGMVAVTIMQAYRDAEQRSVDRAESAAHVVAINGKWIYEVAQQALRRIDDAVGPDIADSSGAKVMDIREAVESLPGTVKAYVVAANGDTLYSTDPQVKPINITDREYFASLAAGARRYTSSLLISRLNGEQIFVFSRRLERRGEFAGAVMISFDVVLLSEVWASLGLDEQSTVSLIRDDGKLVARFPLARETLDLKDHPLFTEHLSRHATGSFASTSPVDGVERIVGYRQISGTDMVAAASISSRAAYAAFRRTAWLALGLGIPTSGALAAAALWIARLLRQSVRRQAEIAQALETNKLLFRDIHHRVKNNLQSVQSLVRMQNIPEQAKRDLQGRIAAMTAVHEHIYRLDRFAEVEAQELIPAIVEPLFASVDNVVRCRFDIDPLRVDRDHATPLALLVNEVVTNALKYGFPDGRKGTISISLKATGEQHGELTIADDGVGFDPETAARGMGSRLISGMVMQMGGTSSYSNEGGTVFKADLRLRSDMPIHTLERPEAKERLSSNNA